MGRRLQLDRLEGTTSRKRNNDCLVGKGMTSEIGKNDCFIREEMISILGIAPFNKDYISRLKG